LVGGVGSDVNMAIKVGYRKQAKVHSSVKKIQPMRKKAFGRWKVGRKR
jgi:hypothetical protein